MSKKQVYETPEMKVFKVHLHSNCCQVVSPMGIPPAYPGSNLGQDFDPECFF